MQSCFDYATPPFKVTSQQASVWQRGLSRRLILLQRDRAIATIASTPHQVCRWIPQHTACAGHPPAHTSSSPDCPPVQQQWSTPCSGSDVNQKGSCISALLCLSLQIFKHFQSQVLVMVAAARGWQWVESDAAPHRELVAACILDGPFQVVECCALPPQQVHGCLDLHRLCCTNDQCFMLRLGARRLLEEQEFCSTPSQPQSTMRHHGPRCHM